MYVRKIAWEKDRFFLQSSLGGVGFMWRGQAWRVAREACWGKCLLSNAPTPHQLFSSRFSVMTVAPPHDKLSPRAQAPRRRPRASTADRVQESLVHSPSPTFTSSNRQYVRVVEIRLQCLQRCCKKGHCTQLRLQWLDSSRSQDCSCYEKCFQHQSFTKEGQAGPEQHRPRICIPRRQRPC